MQEIMGSVRRSFVFRSPSSPDHDEPIIGTLVDKFNSCVRKSRVFSNKPIPSSSPSSSSSSHHQIPKDHHHNPPQIRWRKGELIGCGAFGRVYMGMNLDSGELLAVKQVLITTNSASKDKAQAHLKELEEEVKLLKNLSHPNIVRYLGTVREEDTLNILLEFVPGGSISSLLGKFGSFPEAVIRAYTKQLLVGLEYLHKNGIMHRDIKGANILVDNKGCIKLADFGASKQVVELATISGAKSMKGTPYWMAPEVIRQTGHSFSADIWSVGCTVIEMATGKPPWSQQYQEVAALFYIGTTKSHPPIPEHLSAEAKDFLLKCLQKEPCSRPAASELLQHRFVTGNVGESHHALHTSVTQDFESQSPTQGTYLNKSEMCPASTVVCDLDNLSCTTLCPDKSPESRPILGANNSDDDMCVIDDKDDFLMDRVMSSPGRDDFIKSINPMCDSFDDWGSKFDERSGAKSTDMDLDIDQPLKNAGCSGASGLGDNDLSLSPCVPSLSEDDEELTELKITAFLDEKALELKKLQTPLYEEFYNSLNAAFSPTLFEKNRDEISSNYLKLPPKSRSPSRVPIGTSPAAVDAINTPSPGSSNRRISDVGNATEQTSPEIPTSQLNDRKGLLVDVEQQPISPSVNFSERQRKWKEELDQELERKREMMRQAGVGGKTSSPNDRALNRQRELTRFASPSKGAHQKSADV